MRMVSARALVAGLIGVAATVIGFAAPAQAAACTRGTGVTVVVQGQGLNSTTCVSNPPRTAWEIFEVHHSLQRVASQPGFVCRIDSRPDIGCGTTPPSNAYWGLYWAHSGGSWSYSTSGAGSLRPNTGDWIAFVFQDGGRRSPSMTPLGPVAPKPKPKPTSAGPTTSKPTATPSATPSAKASDAAKKSDEKKSDSTAGAAPGSDETAAGTSKDDVRNTSADVNESSAALLWVAAVLGVGLVAAAVVIARARSQRS